MDLTKRIYQKLSLEMALLEENEMWIPFFNNIQIKVKAERDKIWKEKQLQVDEPVIKYSNWKKEIAKWINMQINPKAERNKADYEKQFQFGLSATNGPSSSKPSKCSQNSHKPTEFFCPTLLRLPQINQPFILSIGATDLIQAKSFWRMIHEQQSQMIVMVCDGNSQNFDYIPMETNQEMQFGQYVVTCKNSIVDNVVCQRELSIEYEKYDTEGPVIRDVVLYQFLQTGHDLPFSEAFPVFHNYIEKALRTDPLIMRSQSNLEKPTHAPVLLSHSGFGRCAVLLIPEVMLRMISENQQNHYNIEKWISILISNNSSAIQSYYDIKLVYKHVIAMMERKNPKLISIGNRMMSFAASCAPLTLSLSKPLFSDNDEWNYPMLAIQTFLKVKDEETRRVDRTRRFRKMGVGYEEIQKLNHMRSLQFQRLFK